MCFITVWVNISVSVFCTLVGIVAERVRVVFPWINTVVCVLGCLNSPAKSLRFCEEHKGIASPKIDNLCEMGSSVGTISGAVSGKMGEFMLPVKIVNKKETRNGKFYEVIALWILKGNCILKTNCLQYNVLRHHSVNTKFDNSATLLFPSYGDEKLTQGGCYLWL